MLAGTGILAAMTALFETRVQRLINLYIEKTQTSNVQLRQEKIKLQEVNSQKDRIFSVISHDLSSPMGNLKILSDHFRSLVAQGEVNHEVLRDISSLIDRSVTSIDVLIDDLLMWSRSQRNTLEFKPERMPAANHANAAIDVCAPIARSKGISLTEKVDSPLVVSADPNMMKTILRNLIVNAIKFTPTGGTVSVELSGDDSGVRYVIRDTGLGMSEQKVAGLFQNGDVQSTRGTNAEKGTGLGLLLCKEFVQQHSGTISVRSVVGEGTEFIVTLPAD